MRQEEEAMKRNEKVFAYITNGRRLLVFTERGFEHFGLQVPAGSVHEDASLEDAVLRESWEEAGLKGLEIVRYLGSVSVDQGKYGLDEIHDRHFFHLTYTGEPIGKWEHIESDPSIVTEHTPDVIVFDLRWIGFENARQSLAEGHDEFLHELW
jgi:8-oxo-dGTP diphosphatase